MSNLYPKAKIVKIFFQHHELNTLQVCRLINGATGKHQITFCRSKARAWRDPNRFKEQGSPYPNCLHKCKHKWSNIYRILKFLESRGVLESRIEFRRDPINPNKKDKVRQWALKGKLPNLKYFIA